MMLMPRALFTLHDNYFRAWSARAPSVGVSGCLCVQRESLLGVYGVIEPMHPLLLRGPFNFLCSFRESWGFQCVYVWVRSWWVGLIHGGETPVSFGRGKQKSLVASLNSQRGRWFVE